MMKEDKTLKEEIQDFYLNGGTYKEDEIDFGKPQGKEDHLIKNKSTNF